METKSILKQKLLYVKKNWLLYVFFLMPALFITIIFRYLPMGGILIAFKDYNVRLGHHDGAQVKIAPKEVVQGKWQRSPNQTYAFRDDPAKYDGSDYSK